MAKERTQAKTQTGVVISTKMQKTITVAVERLVKHPKYGKFIRRRTKLTAHDEHGTAHEGDTVEIAFTRPLSKNKRWRLIRVVRSTSLASGPATKADAGGAPEAPNADADVPDVDADVVSSPDAMGSEG